MTTENHNVAALILERAQKHPERIALILPEKWDESAILKVRQLTYGELAGEIGKVRGGLEEVGLKAGDHVVVLFPVQLELYVLILALAASGMVSVMIDVGMGKKGLLQALKRSKAKAVVSVDALLRHRLWLPALWGKKRFSVDSERFGVKSYERLTEGEAIEAPALQRAKKDRALITFTSGSTGRPKGANRTHGVLMAQHLALAEHLPHQEGDIDMPCFPVVTLHNLCCGMTTVLPAVDFAAPAKVNPAMILQQLRAYQVTRMSGAPAYLDAIVRHMLENDEQVDTLRWLGCGGAPTSRALCERIVNAKLAAHPEVIYGSTEAEPIASVSMREILDSPGEGFLVGETAHAATIALVNLPDPMPQLVEEGLTPYLCQNGDVGELLVSGDHVIKDYINDPQATAETKLKSLDGITWHRTGDLARRDPNGRIWLVGRTKDRVRHKEDLIDPYPIEASIDAIQGVTRAAIVAPAGQEATLFLQLKDPKAKGAVEDYLHQNHWTWPIQIVPEIPMDRRHNSKVDRESLRDWS